MQRLSLTIVFFICSASLLLANDVVLFNQKQTGFKKIFDLNGSKYLVTSNAVYSLSKNKLDEKIKISDSCNDGCVYNNNILLATNKGLLVYDKKTNNLTKITASILPEKISHVTTDFQNNIWFTKEFAGGFKIQHDSVLLIIDAPAIYSLAATPDGNVWIGSNIGLYKISLPENKIYRFVEEGIEGYELPDNLVEKIYADNNSDVWAVMPANISFISHEADDEIPDYNSVGSAQNEVLDICNIPAVLRAYIFATKQGMIYTSNLKGDQFNHTGEIHQEFHESGFFVDSRIAEKPEILKDELVTNIQICNNNIFFITAYGFWSIKLEKFEKNITKKVKHV